MKGAGRWKLQPKGMESRQLKMKMRPTEERVEVMYAIENGR